MHLSWTVSCGTRERVFFPPLLRARKAAHTKLVERVHSHPPSPPPWLGYALCRLSRYTSFSGSAFWSARGRSIQMREPNNSWAVTRDWCMRTVKRELEAGGLRDQCLYETAFSEVSLPPLFLSSLSRWRFAPRLWQVRCRNVSPRLFHAGVLHEIME